MAWGKDLPGPLRSVDEHVAEALGLAGPLLPVELELTEAAGHYLAERVVSPWPLPLFDNSAMDGYALRSADVVGASRSAPVALEVRGDIPAGPIRGSLPSVDSPGGAVDSPGGAIRSPGGAVRIMTGAPIPPGADAVVPVEATDAGMHRVRVYEAVPAGANVRAAGEDASRGDAVLAAGDLIGPAQVALLASVGIARVTCHRAPRVAIFSTGDELVEPGEMPGLGQVPESNSYALAAGVAQLGARPWRLGSVPDDPGALRQLLDRVGAEADMVISSGGVSAGAFDVVKEVLGGSGTVSFVKVAMRPGMPQGIGTLGNGVPFFGLPGNPASALVSFTVFVVPAIGKMMGSPSPLRRPVMARSTERLQSVRGKREYLRVRAEVTPEGALSVRGAGGRGSHLVAGMAAANALAVVPEDCDEVRAGEEVGVLPWSGPWW